MRVDLSCSPSEDHVRVAFPQEFPGWLEAGLAHLPPSVGSKAGQVGSLPWALKQLTSTWRVALERCAQGFR